MQTLGEKERRRRGRKKDDAKTRDRENICSQ
jgi:hypothetical protein